MRQSIVQSTVLILAMLPGVALAHTGDHGHMPAAEQAEHFLTQPGHIAYLTGGVALVLLAALGFVAWRRLFPSDR